MPGRRMIERGCGPGLILGRRIFVMSSDDPHCPAPQLMSGSSSPVRIGRGPSVKEPLMRWLELTFGMPNPSSVGTPDWNEVIPVTCQSLNTFLASQLLFLILGKSHR